MFKHLGYLLIGFLVYPPFCPSADLAELHIERQEDAPLIFEIHQDESFVDVIESVCGYLASEKDQAAIKCFRISLEVNEGKIIAKSLKNPDDPPRDYYTSCTPDDKEDIGFILRTIANTSIFKILSYKSSLDKAGDRVQHVHPFRFLECIFTDEELKVCIRNIQGKGWVWKDFLYGITSSLEKESAVDNLKSEYIKEFARRVNIDQKLILSSLKKQDWKKLVEVLIENVPREGDPNRYDM